MRIGKFGRAPLISRAPLPPQAQSQLLLTSPLAQRSRHRSQIPLPQLNTGKPEPRLPRLHNGRDNLLLLLPQRLSSLLSKLPLSNSLSHGRIHRLLPGIPQPSNPP